MFPALLCSLPFLLLQYAYFSPDLQKVFQTMGNIEVFGNITLSLAALFLMMEICRFYGKDFWENFYFKKKTKFPTTLYLLHSNKEYSKDYKKQIHSQINRDFGIELLNASAEKRNKKKANKKIIEAVSLIQEKMRKNDLVLEHNIIYGFWRNLLGGSIAAFSISFIMIFLSFLWNQPVLYPLLLIVFYFLIAFFGIIALDKRAKQYAYILFQSYMGNVESDSL